MPLLLLLPAAAALALGLWGLERGRSMWRDESVTWQVAHRPLADLWGLLDRVDAVHGLYYLLLHGLFSLWDGGLWTLRLPSVLATALAAAGVAAVGRRLAGDRAALSAGLLYAVLPPVQTYAQEGRSYALVAAAVVWSTYALLRARWTAYTVLLVLACWLHEFAVLALLAHAPAGWRARGWRWSAGAVCGLLLPLAVLSAGQAGRQLGWLGRPGVADWAAYAVVAAAALLSARFLLARDTPTGGADLPSAPPADGRALVRVALPLALLPAGLLMAVSLVDPWYVDRYVLYSLAGLALLAGTALTRLRPRAWVPITATLAAAFLPWSLWLRTPDSRKDDALAVAAAVRATARPGDAVLFMPSRRREWLLSSPDVYAGLDDLALAGTPTATRSLWGTELPSAEIRSRLAGTPRVVALLDPADEPRDPYPREAVKRQMLVAYFDLCSIREVRGARVALYARPGQCG
ncbi:glycosyltransferase family 39 protein [Streptomyces sp. NPDC089799]|uniref:glycosyltransferase family 39 protein n=1 Tax=Streptomyces sp. NPDC089799 TaxID=3155066 RepID=UPI003442D32D